MNALVEVIAPVFVVIFAGFGATWAKWCDDEIINGVKRFAQTFAVPCLLYRGVRDIDISILYNSGLLQSFFISSLTCFALGMMGGHYLFKRAWEDSVVIGFACLFSNSALLGLAITERAYGSGALSGNFAILAVHTPLNYAVGICVMEIVKAKADKSPPRVILRTTLSAMFHNALVIGIVLGLLVNISGIKEPFIIREAVDWMALAALPAALFSLGGTIFRLKIEGNVALIAMICGISLAIHPTLVSLWGTQIFTLSQEHLRSGVVTAAMAPGINAFLFADYYGRAQRVAASSVLLGTAVSVLTIWAWLAYLG